MVRTVLIVGLGQIGMGYDALLNPKEFILTHARACDIHPDFEIIGGVDSSKVNREKFQKMYQSPGFENLEAALNITKPNLVIIATPTQTHLEIVNKILSYYSPQAILCEKPLAYSLEEAKKIVELCASHHIRLYVNYHRRSDSGVQRISEMLNELPAEEKIKGICWYSKGIYNNGSHFLNLLGFWLGQVEDFAIIQKGRVWQDIDPEPDVIFHFRKGSVVFLSAKEENFSHYTIELVSSLGRLRYDKGGKNILWQSKISDPVVPGYTVLDNQINEIANNMHFAQLNVLEQINLDLENKKANICSGEEALNVLLILNQLKAKL